MQQFIICTDQTGREIKVPQFPSRIISLVPSQTELLSDLGLDNEVAGITKFCIHPDHWFRTKVRVGGTKKLNMDVIHALQPDLILANKEENTRSDIEDLMQHYPVWVSDINSVEDAIDMIQQVGKMCNRLNESLEICSEISSLMQVKSTLRNVIYVIWNEPLMVAGADTFISDMLKYAGYKNCITQNRYPVLSDEDVRTLNPDRILLSSEPFPFSEKHMAVFQERFPGIEILLVDGELYSWYGSRMIRAFRYFNSLPL